MVPSPAFEYRDPVQTTALLHAEADAAAARGDFRTALAAAAEILDENPFDHRARVKAGLCLAARGRVEDAASALLVVARDLLRRGFSLAAVGACRDALSVSPGHLGVMRALETIHDRIHGLEGSPSVRALPPIVPMELEAPRRFRTDAPDLEERARAAAVTAPALDGGAEATEEVPPQPAPFFSDLRREVFMDLVPRLAFRKLPADQRLFEQGDLGGSLFVVVSGEVEIARAESGEAGRVLARLGAGQLFGEMSLLTQKPRSASARTLRPTELFEIDRRTVEAVAAEHPRVVEDLVRFARRRLIENLLATSPLFRALGQEERGAVLAQFDTRVVKPKERLIEAGTPSPGLFLVLEGTLEVSIVDADGDVVVLAYLREGEVAGEISLLEGTSTRASVQAAERSVVLHLTKARFDRLVEEHPAMKRYLAQLASERIEEADQAVEAAPLDADGLVLL